MITCQKELFSLDGQHTYLNCAYMSPILKSVEEAGIAAIKNKRNPAHVSAEDFFTESEALRSSYAKLINVTDPKRIAIIPSVSYGISTVSKNVNLKKGQKVIVAGEQFPSNYYPWKRLCDENEGELISISAPNTTGRGKAWNEALLEAIDESVAVVAIAHVHWADGTLFDLMQIRKRTRAVGALLIIDGTQSVGALPFDVAKIKPDALICSGYKWLLGPYSIGLGYFGEVFDNGVPLEENWINRYDSEDFAGLVNYNDNYQPGALRYEVGEHSNFILVPMLKKAIDQINSWGVSNIQQYCNSLFTNANTILTDNGFKIENLSYRSAHLFGIRLNEANKMDKLKIAIQKNNISVSLRGDAIRVAPHLYNDEQDVEKLVTVLTSI
jgi:selenocysteine lyase/cysteine desulfurase